MAYPLVELIFAPARSDGPADPLPRPRGSPALVAQTSQTDAELVRLIRAGDESAFTALVHELATVLQAYAYRYVGSADVAGDVVQDVFLRIWERRATLRRSDRAVLYR